MASKRTHKQSTASAGPAGSELPNVSASANIEETSWRFVIAGALVLLFGLFYLSQNLFQVNNLNDFGEYMMRAQDWAAGKFVLTGGSDILLSAIEYLALLAHPTDFMGFYSMTISILTGLTLVASFVFLVRTNPMLPDFWVRLGMTAIFLSIPHFIIATRTVDQTLLFGACLLLWIATYDVPWAGIVAVLTWFSRPEAIIILPLYVLVYLVHKERRKQILINAATFAALMIVFKILTSAGGGGPATAEYQQFGFLSKISWAWFLNLLSHLINIPVLVVVYAMEALQNSLLVAAFCLGIVISIRQRSAILMYAVLVLFCLAYAVLAAEGEPGTYSTFTSVIRRMTLEREYFIVNAFNKFDAIIGHGRYRLVLYPIIAFFVVNGVATALRAFIKSPTKHTYLNYATVALSLLISGTFLFSRYPAPSKGFQTNVQLESMPQIMKVAMALRGSESGSRRLYIEGFCDGGRGSFMSEFAVFSGIREYVLRVCPGTEFWQDGPAPIGTASEYTRMHPFNAEALMLFHDISVRRSEASDPVFCQRLQAAVSRLELPRLKEAGITHVVSVRDLPLSHLKRLGSIGNIRYYAVVGI